jgi:hypothetical protein
MLSKDNLVFVSSSAPPSMRQFRGQSAVLLFKLLIMFLKMHVED